MDFSGLFAAYYALMAIILMAFGAFLFWFITDALPYLWHHIQWVN